MRVYLYRIVFFINIYPFWSCLNSPGRCRCTCLFLASACLKVSLQLSSSSKMKSLSSYIELLESLWETTLNGAPDGILEVSGPKSTWIYQKWLKSKFPGKYPWENVIPQQFHWNHALSWMFFWKRPKCFQETFFLS